MPLFFVVAIHRGRVSRGASKTVIVKAKSKESVEKWLNKEYLEVDRSLDETEFRLPERCSHPEICFKRHHFAVTPIEPHITLP